MARAWVMLAWTVKAGIPAPRLTSPRGPLADTEAFVLAMHVISAPIAQRLVAQLQPLTFSCLLDVGGATGTWTEAFLNEVPGATAIVVDLPAVIEAGPAAIEPIPFRDRIRLLAGDYLRDPLPGPVDFALGCAHLSPTFPRGKSADFPGKFTRCVSPGGKIAIRDIILELSRIRPASGGSLCGEYACQYSWWKYVYLRRIRRVTSERGRFWRRAMPRVNGGHELSDRGHQAMKLPEDLTSGVRIPGCTLRLCRQP